MGPLNGPVNVVNKVQNVLNDVSQSVTSEQNATDAQYNLTLAQYDEAIRVYNYTLLQAHQNLSIIDDHIGNLTERMEKLEHDLATIDERITERKVKIDDASAKIVAGDKLRA